MLDLWGPDGTLVTHADSGGTGGPEQMTEADAQVPIVAGTYILCAREYYGRTTGTNTVSGSQP